MNGAGEVTRIRVKLFGFGSRSGIVEITVGYSASIRDVVDAVATALGLEISHDEVLVLCKEKQLYPNDYLPSSCSELEFFPLALGG